MFDGTVLFLHVEKTGGTSLYTILTGLVSKENSCSGSAPKISKQQIGGYWNYGTSPTLLTDAGQPPKIVLGHYYFGIHTRCSAPATYITLFRDPVDHFISNYYVSRDARNPNAPGTPTVRACGSIECFADVLYEYKVTGQGDAETKRAFDAFNNRQTRKVAGFALQEQQDLTDVLQVAISNLDKHFAYIILTPQISTISGQLADRFGWPEPPSSLYNVKRNVTPNHSRKLPNLKCQEKIRAIGDADCTLYDYAVANQERINAREIPTIMR